MIMVGSIVKGMDHQRKKGTLINSHITLVLLHNNLCSFFTSQGRLRVGAKELEPPHFLVGGGRGSPKIF